MPKFYFQIVERDLVLDDPDGADVGSLQEARREAARAIREIAAEHLKIERKLDLTSIQIKNESGSLVATVTYDDAMANILP